MTSEAKTGPQKIQKIGRAYEVDFTKGGRDYDRPKTELIELDMMGVVDQLERGITPEQFPFLEPVFDSTQQEPGLRLMAPLRELQVAQELPERDIEREARIVVLVDLLNGTCDEHLNDLGFCAQLKDKNGHQQFFQYGHLYLDSDLRWVLQDMYSSRMPLGGVAEYVPFEPTVV